MVASRTQDEHPVAKETSSTGQSSGERKRNHELSKTWLLSKGKGVLKPSAAAGELAHVTVKGEPGFSACPYAAAERKAQELETTVLMRVKRTAEELERKVLTEAITADLKNFQDASRKVLQLTREAQAFSDQLTRLHEAALGKYDAVAEKLSNSVERFYSNYNELQRSISKFVVLQDKK